MLFFFCGHPHCLLCSQEFEEEQEEEWKSFVPAPRYTEADELNDLKSLQKIITQTSRNSCVVGKEEERFTQLGATSCRSHV